jgi:serine/threonine protein kinase
LIFDFCRNGIVLGNLHPSHILLSKAKSVLKITNFGMPKPSELCCKNCKAHCEKYLQVSDSKYVAPEVFVHLKHSKEADMWSLGCIFCEMLLSEYKGVFFYDCMMDKIGFYTRLRNSITRNYVSEVANVVLQLIDFNPSKRPTAEAVYSNVSKFIQDRLFEKYITCNVKYISTPSWIPAKNSHTGCYSKGIMYMFGGWTNTNTNDLHAYDTRNKQFIKIVPKGKKLPMGRSGASLCAYEDSLWLFGGWGKRIDMSGR